MKLATHPAPARPRDRGARRPAASRHALVGAVLLALAIGCGDGAPAVQRPDPLTAVGADPRAPWPPWTVLRRWGEPVALAVEVDEAEGPLAPGALHAATRAACAAWTATGLVELRVVEAPEATPADVTVGWGHAPAGGRSPFGPRPGVALTRVEGVRPEVLLDPARTWRGPEDDEPEGAPRLLPTLAHELGHVLGLGHTERPDALASTRADLAHDAPQPPDLAALTALYGDPGAAAAPGDLVVLAAGTSDAVAPPLKGLATHGRSAFALGDADGDGDDELYIWRTDREGHNALVLLDFTRAADGGPRVHRTYGPWIGVSLPEALAGPVLAEDGTPAFLVVEPDDRWRAYRLSTERLESWETDVLVLQGLPGDADGDGVLDLSSPSERERFTRGLQRRVGDLDGDGRREEVRLAR